MAWSRIRIRAAYFVLFGFPSNATLLSDSAQRTMNRLFAIAAILFCFELAAFLVIVPWSSLWENNLLFAYAPLMRPILLHIVVRASITCLGLLNLLIGISEVRHYFNRPRHQR